ncbi:MAG: hypothetical protein ACFB51_19680 [Anaerolineae bacterium]
MHAPELSGARTRATDAPGLARLHRAMRGEHEALASLNTDDLLALLHREAGTQTLRLACCDIAERVLPVFTARFPHDGRPAAYIEAVRAGNPRVFSAAYPELRDLDRHISLILGATHLDTAVSYALHTLFDLGMGRPTSALYSVPMFSLWAIELAVMAGVGPWTGTGRDIRDAERAWQTEHLRHKLVHVRMSAQ